MGGEIFTHLRRAGVFEESHTKFYSATVLCALQHMHDRCIAYRDLKPENLVLDDQVLQQILLPLSSLVSSSLYMSLYLVIEIAPISQAVTISTTQFLPIQLAE